MYEIGPINATGAFTGDFGIAPDAPSAQIPQDIERDREIMVQQPGMRQKHLPVHIDHASGRLFAGGRYLFDTYSDAVAYHRWVTEEFAPDGVPFPERSYFVQPQFLAWRVIGAHDYAPLETHTGIRMQRWSLPAHANEQALAAIWPGIQQAAARAGLASAWLLFSPERREAALVTVTARDADAAGQGEQALTAALDGVAEARTFDRSDLVWTLWMPRAAEGQPPALWPNSPPLPAPVPAPI
ncbi:MAG TPA: hypothetical protein VGX50_14270 [Longimicrobium sp.]|jgi:hypothetical protein|nr:hypothetical protein [Longimicrobium sp.]